MKINLPAIIIITLLIGFTIFGGVYAYKYIKSEDKEEVNELGDTKYYMTSNQTIDMKVFTNKICEPGMCATDPIEMIDDFRIKAGEYVLREYPKNKTYYLYYIKSNGYVTKDIIPKHMEEEYQFKSDPHQVGTVSLTAKTPLIPGQNMFILELYVMKGKLARPMVCVDRTAEFLYFDLIEYESVMNVEDFPVEADRCWHITDFDQEGKRDLTFMYKTYSNKLNPWDKVSFSLVDNWKDFDKLELEFPQMNYAFNERGEDLGMQNLFLEIKR